MRLLGLVESYQAQAIIVGMTYHTEPLARWFQRPETNIIIDSENRRCLTSNSNLQGIWQQIIRHCHPSDHVNQIEKDDQEQNSIRSGTCEEALTKANSDLTKQNIPTECAKLRTRLEDRKRDVLSCRSSILDCN